MNGRYIYTANYGDGTVTAQSIEPTTGVLKDISSSAYPTGGTNPTGIVVDPTNQFVYVTNKISNTITGFNIDKDTGQLSQTVDGSPFSTGNTPTFMTTVRIAQPTP
jgi:6-phosphogluconolactonase